MHDYFRRKNERKQTIHQGELKIKSHLSVLILSQNIKIYFTKRIGI